MAMLKKWSVGLPHANEDMGSKPGDFEVSTHLFNNLFNTIGNHPKYSSKISGFLVGSHY